MIIDGRKIKAEEGKCLVRKSDRAIRCKEITLGYTYYIGGKKLDTPHLEQPEDYEEVESAESAISEVTELIEEYDKSEAVNSFVYKGQTAWLDKATRVGLMNSTTIQLKNGERTTQLWLDGQPINIGCEELIRLLEDLEQYALQCYTVTEMHKAAIKGFVAAEEVREYDYTQGYPDKIVVE